MDHSVARQSAFKSRLRRPTVSRGIQCRSSDGASHVREMNRALEDKGTVTFILFLVYKTFSCNMVMVMSTRSLMEG